MIISELIDQYFGQFLTQIEYMSPAATARVHFASEILVPKDTSF